MMRNDITSLQDRGHVIAYDLNQATVNSDGKPIIAEVTLEALIQKPFKVAFIKSATDPESRKQGYAVMHQTILSAIESSNYDLIIAPEYSYFPNTKPLQTEDNQEIRTEICAATNGKSSLVLPGTIVWKDQNDDMRNSLYAFSNGIELIEYHKINPCNGEKLYAYSYDLNYSSGISPAVFNWNQLKIGVEICLDYGELNKFNFNNLDLRVLIASGSSEGFRKIDLSVLKQDGVALAIDGFFGYHYAVKKPLL